ncbi:MAG: GGDEF domain-containing protein, partial [Actinomycetota bacterium]
MDRRYDRLFASLGVVAVGIYVLTRHANVAGWLAYDGIGAVSVAAVFVGIKRNKPAHALPWKLIGCGLALFVGGDLIWGVYDNVLHQTPPVFSMADLLYLPAYVFLAAGCLVFARLKQAQRGDWAFDGVITAVVGMILVWAFVIVPETATNVTWLGRIMVASYPVLDVVLLTALIRVVLIPGRRTTALWLVLGAFTILLLGDIAYAMLQQTSSYQGGLIDASWLLSYVALGAAALHPRMAQLTERDPHPASDPGGWRRTLLIGSALLTGPVVITKWELREPGFGSAPVVVASAVVTLAVLWRLVRETRLRDEAEGTLRFLALHDDLTHLPNRRLLLDRLGQALARTERNGSSVGVVFLSLDRFKEIKDTYGYDTGDRLLVAAAKRIRAALRPADTLARFDGDEFVLLCEDLEH